MPVSFEDIRVGTTWDRKQLAELWGYESYHAIARGAVTPKKKNLVVFFITGEKQSSAFQYQNTLQDDVLKIEGETNHSADPRIINAEKAGDEIHLFYRKKHHLPFTYYGRILLTDHQPYPDRPSRFTFRLIDVH